MLGVFSGVWTKLPLRLAIALCISGRYEEAFYVIAVVCSSWSAVNSTTSKRDVNVLNPYGDQSLPGVRCGNRMVARRGDPGYTKQTWSWNMSTKRGLYGCFPTPYKPISHQLPCSGWHSCWSSWNFWGSPGWWRTWEAHAFCFIRWAIKTIKDFGGHVTKQIK